MQGHFEAKKHAIRQTQDGWVVSFVIHPNDMTPEFAAAPLGTRLMLGFAEITDEEEAAAPATGTAQAPARKNNDAARERGRLAYATADEMEKARTRAALLCKDRAFQEFVCKWGDSLNEVTAAARLKKRLNIKSRSEIATDQRAFLAFLALEQEYKESAGLSAERRG